MCESSLCCEITTNFPAEFPNFSTSPGPVDHPARGPNFRRIPIRRHVNGMLEAVIDITPGLSVTLPAQLDFWGKEKTRQSCLLVRIASLAGATPASTLLL